VNGTSGVDGINGSSGTSGTSGIDGLTGSSGTSGVMGTSGTSGSSGTSGGGGGSTSYPSYLNNQFGINAFSNPGAIATNYKTSLGMYGYATGTKSLGVIANNFTGAILPFASGSVLKELKFYVAGTAVAGSTVKIGVYKCAIIGTGSTQYILPTDLVYTISESVATATTGAKIITGLNYTFDSANTVNDLWVIGFVNSAIGVTIGTYTQALSYVVSGDDQSGTLYRLNGFTATCPSFALPTTIPTTNMRGITENLQLLYKSYKA
jgi:hypothetical protein